MSLDLPGVPEQHLPMAERTPLAADWGQQCLKLSAMSNERTPVAADWGQQCLKLSSMSDREADSAIKLFVQSVRQGDMNAVAGFLQRGTNVNALSQFPIAGHDQRGSVLHLAVSRNDLPMMKLLIESRADVRAKSCFQLGKQEWQEEPIHTAAKRCLHQGAQLLISSRADPNVRSVRGGKEHGTPLLLSIAHGSEICVQMLLDRNADMTIRNSDGRNPLMQAAFFGQDGILLKLLEARAEPQLEALELALDRNRDSCVEILLTRLPQQEALERVATVAPHLLKPVLEAWCEEQSRRAMFVLVADKIPQMENNLTCSLKGQLLLIGEADGKQLTKRKLHIGKVGMTVDFNPKKSSEGVVTVLDRGTPEWAKTMAGWRIAESGEDQFSADESDLHVSILRTGLNATRTKKYVLYDGSSGLYEQSQQGQDPWHLFRFLGSVALLKCLLKRCPDTGLQLLWMHMFTPCADMQTAIDPIPRRADLSSSAVRIMEGLTPDWRIWKFIEDDMRASRSDSVAWSHNPADLPPELKMLAPPDKGQGSRVTFHVVLMEALRDEKRVLQWLPCLTACPPDVLRAAPVRAVVACSAAADVAMSLPLKVLEILLTTVVLSIWAWCDVASDPSTLQDVTPWLWSWLAGSTQKSIVVEALQIKQGRVRLGAWFAATVYSTAIVINYQPWSDKAEFFSERQRVSLSLCVLVNFFVLGSTISAFRLPGYYIRPIFIAVSSTLPLIFISLAFMCACVLALTLQYSPYARESGHISLFRETYRLFVYGDPAFFDQYDIDPWIFRGESAALFVFVLIVQNLFVTVLSNAYVEAFDGAREATIRIDIENLQDLKLFRHILKGMVSFTRYPKSFVIGILFAFAGAAAVMIAVGLPIAGTFLCCGALLLLEYICPAVILAPTRGAVLWFSKYEEDEDEDASAEDVKEHASAAQMQTLLQAQMQTSEDVKQLRSLMQSLHSSSKHNLVVKPSSTDASPPDSSRQASIIDTWAYFCKKLHDMYLQRGVTSMLLEKIPETNYRKAETTPGIVMIIGGPGAGKGTLCKALVEKYRYVHWSAGDAMRREVRAGTPKGQKIEAFNPGLKDPKIRMLQIPEVATILAGLFLKAVARGLMAGRIHYLLDGFPKNATQALELDNMLGLPSCCLSLEAPDDILIRRICKRGVESGPGGRSDDNEASTAKRLEVFHSSVAEVKEYYKSKGVLHTIDATGTESAVLCAVEDALQLQISNETQMGS